MTAAVKLVSIECIDQNEHSQDEPYLNFNGQRVWSGDMDQGDAVNLSHLGPFLFDGAASLSLFEDDPGFLGFDKDDHLGSRSVFEWQAPGGPFAVDFTGSDAHYRLYVDVLGVAFA